MSSADYYAQNRERIRAYNREYYQRNREKIIAKTREYRERNPGRVRDKSQALYRRNREQILEDRRDYYQRNSAQVRERVTAYASRNPDKIRAGRMRHNHDMRPEEWAAFWDAQGGLCYLCGEELSGMIAVDHDHSCCPQNRSCSICRRGLTHNLCNVAIGFAGDDPVRLRRMADALEAAQRGVEQRKAAAPEQLQLDA